MKVRLVLVLADLDQYSHRLCDPVVAEMRMRGIRDRVFVTPHEVISRDYLSDEDYERQIEALHDKADEVWVVTADREKEPFAKVGKRVWIPYVRDWTLLGDPDDGEEADADG